MKPSVIIISVASTILGACTTPVRVAPATVAVESSQKKDSSSGDCLVGKFLGPESLAGDFVTGGIYTGFAFYGLKIDHPLPSLTRSAPDDASSIHFTAREGLSGSIALGTPTKKEPNQALEPTTTAVTPPAGQEARQP
jgi:hypothetical protein